MAIRSNERSKVQRLYDACSMVFSSEKKRSPTHKQIRWLKGILGNRTLPLKHIYIELPLHAYYNDVLGSFSSDCFDSWILDSIEPVDVGLDGSSDGRSRMDESSMVSQDGLILGQALTKITYVHIHECDDFSVCKSSSIHLRMLMFVRSRTLHHDDESFYKVLNIRVINRTLYNACFVS